MNFETLNKNGSTNYRGSKKPKASRARNIAVWASLFLGGIALATSTTGCSKETKQERIETRKTFIKANIIQNINDEIFKLNQNKFITSNDIPIAVGYTQDYILPVLEYDNGSKNTMERYKITKKNMMEIINNIAEKNPEFKFGLEYKPHVPGGVYILKISRI